MASAGTRGLVIAATLVGSILAGTNVNRAVVEMPAWQQTGPLGWAAFSRHADLGRRAAILYPGSAFAGLNGNTQWYNTMQGICFLVGRFMLMIPALAIAGSLGRKQPVPASAGTFPTGTPLFAALLTTVVVIVVGLTYFPIIALGPVVEHLVGKF